jgi:hypothetical protein
VGAAKLSFSVRTEGCRNVGKGLHVESLGVVPTENNDACLKCTSLEMLFGISENTVARTKCKAITLNEIKIILFYTLIHINQSEELKF